MVRRLVEEVLNDGRLDVLEAVVRTATCAGGRRFTNVAEVYFFTITGGRISRSWGLEDIPARLNRLGLGPPKEPC